MAPKVAIGWPNCLRVGRVPAPPRRSRRLAPPMHIAPSLKRPKLSTLNATLWPLPISPSRFVGRHLHVLQQDRRRRRAVQAHLVLFLAARHAGERALDDERGEVLAVDLREDDEDVGEAAVGDPHLLAVEDEAAVGLPRRARLGAERVGARRPTRSARRRRPIRRTRAAAGTSASAPRCRTAGSAGCRGWPARRRSRRTTPTARCARETTSDADLVELDAAVRLGDVDAEQAELAAARCTSVARQRPVLLLEPIERRQHLAARRTRRAVCAISRCSSVSCSGVKTSCRLALSSSHAPPFASSARSS